MNQIKNLFLGLMIYTVVGVACHEKSSMNNGGPASDTSSVSNSATAPVVISSDDSLQRGVRDATKDYQGVNATVNSGEITLTGDITRDNLTGLMQSLNNLHPKKIINNLNIK